MAMQAESFWTRLLKVNTKPLVVTVGVVVVLVGWLCLIHFIHQKDDPNHVVSNRDWAQQLTSTNLRENPTTQSDPSAATQFPTASAPAPSVFGSPNPAYEPQAAPINNRTYSNRTPSLAPMMFSRFMPGYSPASEGQTAPLSSMMSAPNPTSNPPSGFAMPQQQSMPTRVHSAERYKVVVSR